MTSHPKRPTPEQIARARELRREMTEAEAALWFQLRDSELGFKFRRQHPVGPFYVDLYCHKARLGIEVDGGQHYEPAAKKYDAERTAYLMKRGITVLRFSNADVLNRMTDVLDQVWFALERSRGSPPSPLPAVRQASPLPRGEGI